MSTIDPVQRRRARAANSVGHPRTLAALWGVGSLLFLFGALLGFGLIGERNSGREMALGIRDFEAEPWINGGAWYALPAAFLLLCAALPLYFYVFARLAGNSARLPRIDPFTIMLAGTTAGLLAFRGLWSQPPKVGFTVSEYDGSLEAWSSGTWAYYWVPVWFPGVTALLCVASFVTCTILTVRFERRQAMVKRMLAAGSPVPGSVTEGLAISPGTRTIASWRFTFTDAQGVQRWVKRINAFDWQTAPKPGQRVWVLFDPANPGNTRSIFVSRTRPDSVEAYS